jgi:hypothetical protein
VNTRWRSALPAELGPILWIGATVIALVVSGFLLHFPGNLGEPTLQPVAAVVGAILGAVNGVAVAIGQWVALGGAARLGALVRWNVVAIGATHALNDGLPVSMGAALVAVLAGIAMSASYAAILGERRPVPVLLIGVAWAFGLFVALTQSSALGFPRDETPIGWATDHAIEGLFVGLIWAPVAAAVGVVGRVRSAPTTALSGEVA